MRISYSGLETYRNCPLKYKFQEIEKIRTPKSKEAVFGTLLHSALKFIHTPAIIPPALEQALDYFARSWNSEVFDSEIEERAAFAQGVKIIQTYYQKNDPAETNIVDLESRFEIKIGDEKEPHVVSGVIDRIDKTEKGYEIIDYKTTKKMPSQEKVDNDIQLSIYLQAFLRRYPKECENIEDITVSLYYLKHGVKLSSNRDIESLKKGEQLFLDTIKLIESAKFEPIVSPLCDWCGYQNRCPMWKHKFKEFRKIDTEEINKIIADYIEIKSAINASKDRLEDLQEKISVYMDQEGVERVFSEQGTILRAIKKSYKYDAEKLREILEPLDKWKFVLKVDGVALKNILSSLPIQIRREAEKTKTINKESNVFVVKKTEKN